MWKHDTSVDRRNSASVLELRRAAKLARQALRSPELRRANSCKERDGDAPQSPSYLRLPYPNYYGSGNLGTPTGSEHEIRLHKFKTQGNNNPRRYESRGYSSLNSYSPENSMVGQDTRSVKDLRNCEAIGFNDETSENDRRFRNNTCSSSGSNSLTDIPEHSKSDKGSKKGEASMLIGSVNSSSVSKYHGCDLFFKVMLLGDTGVGKTCLITKYRDNIFLAGNFIATVGIDYRHKTIEVDGSRMHLQIWDTAGQERFRSLTRAYYRDAQALLLLYDIQNRNSFNNIRNWLADVRQQSTTDVVVLLIGNKSDLATTARAVTVQEGQELAQDLGVTFLETSAKSGTNVELAFTAVAKQLKHLQATTDSTDKDFNVEDYVRRHNKDQSSYCSMCHIC